MLCIIVCFNLIFVVLDFKNNQDPFEIYIHKISIYSSIYIYVKILIVRPNFRSAKLELEGCMRLAFRVVSTAGLDGEDNETANQLTHE